MTLKTTKSMVYQTPNVEEVDFALAQQVLGSSWGNDDTLNRDNVEDWY